MLNTPGIKLSCLFFLFYFVLFFDLQEDAKFPMLVTRVTRVSRRFGGVKTNAILASRQLSSAASLDFRRLKLKSYWRPPLEEDADYFVFPRECWGNDYNTNWALCAHDIPPSSSGSAYRNLHLRGLHMLCSRKLDENRAVHITVPEWHSKHVRAGIDISPETYSRIEKSVRRHLSYHGLLFLQDGAVGSNRSGIKTRVICDTPELGCFLHNVITRVPKACPRQFGPEVTVFVANSMSEENAIDWSEHGLEVSPSSCVTIFDEEMKRILLVGQHSPTLIQDALREICTPLFLEHGILPLPAHIALRSDGSSALVFGEASFSKEHIFGTHTALWESSGVSRGWDGVTLPSSESPKRGDVVEHSKEGTKVTSFHKSIGNVAPHPTLIVFVSDNNQGKVDMQTAKDLLSKMLESAPKKTEIMEMFAARVQSQQVPIHCISAENLPKLVL